MIGTLMVLPEVKLVCMAVHWQALCRGHRVFPVLLIFTHTNYIHWELCKTFSGENDSENTISGKIGPCLYAGIWSVVQLVLVEYGLMRMDSL